MAVVCANAYYRHSAILVHDTTESPKQATTSAGQVFKEPTDPCLPRW